MKTPRPKKGKYGRQELEERTNHRKRTKLKPNSKPKYKIRPNSYQEEEDELYDPWSDLGDN